MSQSRHAIRSGAVVAGGAALATAIAALGPSGSFLRIFLYVVCTLGVCACATGVTIGMLARLMRGRSGDASGLVEIGLLIGLFVVSPLALSGAFQLLEAFVGPP